ncbi:hypothetical protein BLNAU_14185 [Blattamonas nauphoetae]|uniref:Uncharacterized protein n=1 Tax=Blattamonas nauphoetae TaxID=2049346 RepID=A0ABQ9XHU1_9EUKA|nr:hypothetical protein BLNAU_14185 [Blattamonas nauphoetae]
MFRRADGNEERFGELSLNDDVKIVRVPPSMLIAPTERSENVDEVTDVVVFTTTNAPNDQEHSKSSKFEFTEEDGESPVIEQDSSVRRPSTTRRNTTEEESIKTTSTSFIHTRLDNTSIIPSPFSSDNHSDEPDEGDTISSGFVEGPDRTTTS